MSDKPLQIVTFFWDDPNAKHRSNYSFTTDHVNKLQKAFKKHLHIPHEFVCITDNPNGIDSSNIRILPLWNDFRDLGRCFTRLKIYSEEMGKLIGPRFAQIDLDVVVVNDVTPIFSRTEEFIGYRDSKNPKCYSGCLYQMNAGAKSQVYHTFRRLYDMTPNENKREWFQKRYNRSSEFVGSDQSWQTEVLGKGLPRWGNEDGLYDHWQIENLPNGELPSNARIILVNGMTRDPSLPSFQEKYPWMVEHWKNV